MTHPIYKWVSRICQFASLLCVKVILGQNIIFIRRYGLLHIVFSIVFFSMHLWSFVFVFTISKIVQKISSSLVWCNIILSDIEAILRVSVLENIFNILSTHTYIYI